MMALYGRHYRERQRVVADLVPAGASVVELCAGPGFLYRRHLEKKDVRYKGLDLSRKVRRRRTST